LKKAATAAFFIGKPARIPYVRISKKIDNYQGAVDRPIPTIRTPESIVGCPRLSEPQEETMPYNLQIALATLGLAATPVPAADSIEVLARFFGKEKCP
jgi:hypothetical protein